ncbi:hypothetical protein PG990_013806 [Apiospora arundinis]
MKGSTYSKQALKDLELLEAAKTAQFLPFSRLPVELRCQIWRATWEPDSVGPNDLKVHDRHRYEPIHGIVSKLPVTSLINQESRAETLRLYKLVPDTAVYTFRAYINYQIDAFELDCIYKPLCPSMTREHFHKVQRLTLQTAAVPDEGVYEDDLSPEGIGYKTLGNFIHYAKTRYFASLRYLSICIPTMSLAIEDVRDDMRHSICRPLLFRSKDGGALRFKPMLLRPDYLDGFQVSFLSKSEATHLGDGQPSEQHQAWLELVGVILWETTNPESWLKQDGVKEYATRRQHHQLL